MHMQNRDRRACACETPQWHSSSLDIPLPDSGAPFGDVVDQSGSFDGKRSMYNKVNGLKTGWVGVLCITSNSFLYLAKEHLQ